MLITILVFLLILSVLVLIHEAGHFFVARKFGIKVEEFGFGFPPRLFGKKIGETIYSINWLPIGGFVKLYGEDEAGAGKIAISDKRKAISKDRNRAFFAKTAWQRAAVIIAGVVMNVILAAVIFYVFLGLSGFKTNLPLLSDYKFFGANQTVKNEVVISAVAKNSPAEKQGLKTLTKIISVNGGKITSSEEFIEIINSNKGKEIEIVWSNLQTNEVNKTKVTPRISPPKDEGALGVGLFSMSEAIISYETPVQKIFSGVVHPINLMAYNLDVMGRLVKVSFEKKTTEPLSQGVSGPVGIASITGSILEIQNVKEKALQLLNLAGILSISLAFFNILPIPALDGGRLFFILIEAVSGRKVNQRIESLAHTIGMIILLSLMVLITFKDIGKLFIK
ncbi:MAG: site-2 protease family protein [Candidatus Levybacteria bacterium]|nr:site-2 protease family protein [Candidatus Levybacteria bacterium]MDZ4227766.1 site-2 protease family protein [Candidatus Levybacteria bacterium]